MAEDRGQRLVRSQFGFGDLEEEMKGGNTRWIHVPARERLQIVILSRRVTRYYGHWVGDRMRICPGKACPLCARRMAVQARYMFSVLEHATRITAILEVGAATVKMMEPPIIEIGRMRGTVFALSHEGGKRNGKLCAEYVGVDAREADLPPEEDCLSQVQRQQAAEEDRIARAVTPPKWEPGDSGSML